MRETAIIEQEIQHLERQVDRLERGEIDPDLFKKLRLQHGIYSMRRAPTGYMVRVKIAQGIATPEQLEVLAEACESLSPSRACHLTTRQDVQLYGIERSKIHLLLRMLSGAGLTTRETSGNVVRNITCCPWAGVSPDEPFDVTPYAKAANDYLLRNPLTQAMPRKAKIAFEGCSADHARTAIHDIGVVAALKGDQPGFRIYAGGGLGSMPRRAQLLEPWTDVGLLLPTIEAVLRIFDRFGDRKNRAKARLKFLIERLGWEQFKKLVLEERTLVWATQSGYALAALARGAEIIDAQGEPAPPKRAPESSEALKRWSATNVSCQKQKGFVSVIVRVPLGDVSALQLRSLASLAREYTGEIRTTIDQNFLLRFVPDTAVALIYGHLKRLGLAEPGAGRLVDVTRCPGADSCLSAITHPRGVGEAVERLCHNGLSCFADAPFSIKVSGCPNSCGHHHIANTGLFGMAIKVGEKHLPCYQLLVGGCTGKDHTKFGKRLARIPAQRVPEAIKRLVAIYQEQKQPNEYFPEFVERMGTEGLESSLKDLADISGAASEPALFVDLGTTEPFRLEAGKGECAA